VDGGRPSDGQQVRRQDAPAHPALHAGATRLRAAIQAVDPLEYPDATSDAGPPAIAAAEPGCSTESVRPSLARHRRQFGRAPDLLTGDRGCSTAAVRREAAALGVRRVALPHTGPPTAASRLRERHRWYQRGYRWRAGIEGRIGVLQRQYGLARCPDHGATGLERWVGWGVLTANLVTIARATTGRTRR
jgi:hypothetical protein